MKKKKGGVKLGGSKLYLKWGERDLKKIRRKKPHFCKVLGSGNSRGSQMKGGGNLPNEEKRSNNPRRGRTIGWGDTNTKGSKQQQEKEGKM